MGLGLIGLQLVALSAWSSFQAGRFALTMDFAGAEQAVWLIAHGDLNPYSTVFAHAYIADHGALIFWPLAILHLAWPHPVTLLWAQDAAMVGAEVIAFLWACEIVAAKSSSLATATAWPLIAGSAAVMLVADPWVVWASSADIHTEPFAALFAVGAARSIHRGKPLRSVLAWLLLGLASGNVGASYLGAVGLSFVLSGRRFLRAGLTAAVTGFGWMVVLGAAGVNLGGSLARYSYVVTGSTVNLVPALTAGTLATSALAHPGRVLVQLVSNRMNLWATLSPVGMLGALWLPSLGPAALVLAEGGLTGNRGFAMPGFQNLAAAPLVAVGTVVGLAGLARRGRTGRRWATLATVALIANSLAWFAIWIPKTEQTWVRVSPAAGDALRHVASLIRPTDSVAVEQGVAGPFADHSNVVALPSPTIDVRRPGNRLWVILAPKVGIEIASSTAIYSDIRELRRSPQARLMVDASGVWAFLVSPSDPSGRFTLSPDPSSAPGWAVRGPAATGVTSGPIAGWRATSNGRPGYVVNGADWRESPGTYRAAVSLSATGPVNVELWNADAHRLLGRLSLPSTSGRTTVHVQAAVRSEVAPSVFSGFGIWRDAPLLPTNDQLEVRVWSPGGTDLVNVYSVALDRVGGVAG